jgi:hypothetical protein
MQKICVEVCQGPDCVGQGGGAALLEIEELILDEKQQCPSSQIQVRRGGCRDQCTVGPNVHVHRLITHATSSSSSSSCNVIRKKNVELLESFNKVNCVERCTDVVRMTAHAANMPDTTTTTTTADISCAPLSSSSSSSSSSKSQSSSMMYRRSQRIRWEILRKVSRTIVKCRREVDASIICDKSQHDLLSATTKIEKTQQSCRDELQKMYRAEMASVPKPPNSNTQDGREAQRAETRRNRLVHLADGMLNPMSVSDDDDEDFSDDCDGVSSSDDEEME